MCWAGSADSPQQRYTATLLNEVCGEADCRFVVGVVSSPTASLPAQSPAMPRDLSSEALTDSLAAQS